MIRHTLLAAAAAALVVISGALAQIGPFSVNPQQGPSIPANNFVQASVAAPAGTTSLVGVMMGLGVNFIPASAGVTQLIISGDITNNTASDGANVQCRFGTGAAPANGAALTGTTLGSLKKWVPAAVTTQKGHFVCAGIVLLNVNTTYWFDVGLAAVTGGTATIADVDVAASEI